MDAPSRCPRCGSEEVIRILYGAPGPDLLEDARSGRVALGGDVFWPEAPEWRNRAPSRKAGHKPGAPEEPGLLALPRSVACTFRAWHWPRDCWGSFMLPNYKRMFAASIDYLNGRLRHPRGGSCGPGPSRRNHSSCSISMPRSVMV
jgi:hypothetical protein